MSFSIQRIESPQLTDNLLITTTASDLLWAGKYLTPGKAPMPQLSRLESVQSSSQGSAFSRSLDVLSSGVVTR